MNSPDTISHYVERACGARARWRCTEAVHLEHDQAVVWDGEVHVFELEGHPQAARCYAWAAETDEGGTRTYAVLGVAPIDSAAAAVRAAIAADYRAGRQP